jgi:hypothetical protein
MALKMTLPDNPPSAFVRIRHNWGGIEPRDCQYLQFWAHGGNKFVFDKVGVQVGLGDGTSSSLVPLSRYAKQREGNWTRIQIPITDLALGNGNTCRWVDFFKIYGAGNTYIWLDDIRFTRPVEVPNPLITVRSKDRLVNVTPEMVGSAVFTWDSELDLDSTKARVRESGVRLLAFPGGSTTNYYDWRTSTDIRTGSVGVVNTDTFLHFSRQAYNEKLISVNYGSGTPQDAADWLYHCNIVKRANVRYWTIGNENYGAWEYDTHPFPHDAYTYAEFVAQAVQLMRAIDPKIKIGIVGTINEYDYPQRLTVTNPRTGAMRNGWGPVMLTRLRELGVRVDYYDFHYYPTGPFMENDSFLLQSADQWGLLMPIMRQMINDYMGVLEGSKIAIHIGETNTNYWLPGKQSTSLVSALFFCESWAKAALVGVGGFIWWNLHNPTYSDGNMSPTLYGWRSVGDYGIVSRGIPPSVAPPLNEPYPSFYAFKQLKNFVRPGESLVSTTSNNRLVSAYGSKSADGKVKLLVINMSKMRSFHTRFNLVDFRPRNMIVYNYGIQNDIDMTDIDITPQPRSAILNGYSFPPYSISVVEFSQ